MVRTVARMSAAAHVVTGMRVGRLALLTLPAAAAAAVAARHALAAGHAPVGVTTEAVRHGVTGVLIGLAGLGRGSAVPGVLALGLLGRVPGMARVGIGGGRGLDRPPPSGPGCLLV
jgi:hypothetical protein